MDRGIVATKQTDQHFGTWMIGSDYRQHPAFPSYSHVPKSLGDIQKSNSSNFPRTLTKIYVSSNWQLNRIRFSIIKLRLIHY
jgi:hypothetical protein